jgi:acetyl-CoA synthetase
MTPTPATIAAYLPPGAPAPNLPADPSTWAAFDWAEARALLDGLPEGRGLNIAYEAVDRHVRHGRGNTIALRWVRKDGQVDDTSYAALAQATSRFANVLDALHGSEPTRVATLLGRQPELYIAALGALKHGSAYSPLFSAFGPEPVRERLGLGEITVLITTARFYARKVAPIRSTLPELRHVLLTDVGPDDAPPEGTASLPALMASASDNWEIPPTDPEQLALLHFTSGTTGTPKGAMHVHEAVVCHAHTGRVALDLQPGDTFWCTADPGWVTGTSYGIIAPLVHGVTSIVDEGDLQPDRWYGILQDQRVDIWYTAPTAVRMLMRSGAEVAREYDLGRVRFIASVGEPLSPEAVRWGVEAFGQPIHDNWWQTETGGIMIAGVRSRPVKPGSMGRPLPGVDATILRRADDGTILLDADGAALEAAPGEQGELALRPGWPSMFRGYLGQPERYARCFAGGWYLSGDLARRDEDGDYWFVGRGDDVIKSAGHLIGPFEVESALLEHPVVAEAGVIGIPDEVAGAVVKAFVVLAAGAEPSEALRRELVGFARTRLGPAVAPRQLDFAPSLPKNRSGKIVRRLLRARELGLPEGDLSTLEPDPATTPEAS